MNDARRAPRMDNPYSHLKAHQAGGGHLSINPLNLAGMEASVVQSPTPYGDTIVTRELPGVTLTPSPQQQSFNLGRNQPGRPGLDLQNPGMGDDIRSKTSLAMDHGPSSALRSAQKKQRGTDMRAIGRFRGSDSPPKQRFA